MNEKKKTAAVQNGKSTPVKETPVRKMEVVKTPTVEELQKKVDELTQRLSAIPEKLEDRITYFNNKKELIRKLSRLQEKRTNLEMHKTALNDLSLNDEFENDDYCLTIEGKDGYSKRSIFELNNPVIIAEMIVFVLGRMDAKIAALEKEIAA